MTIIKSNLTHIEQDITTIKSGAGSLLKTSHIDVSRDSQTTIEGNYCAQKTINAAQSTAQQISNTILSAAENLHSIAKSFADFDEMASKTSFSLKGKVEL